MRDYRTRVENWAQRIARTIDGQIEEAVMKLAPAGGAR